MITIYGDLSTSAAIATATTIAATTAVVAPASATVTTTTTARVGRIGSFDIGAGVVGRLRSVAEAIVVARPLAIAVIALATGAAATAVARSTDASGSTGRAAGCRGPAGAPAHAARIPAVADAAGTCCAPCAATSGIAAVSHAPALACSCAAADSTRGAGAQSAPGDAAVAGTHIAEAGATRSRKKGRTASDRPGHGLVRILHPLPVDAAQGLRTDRATADLLSLHDMKTAVLINGGICHGRHALLPCPRVLRIRRD